MKAEDVAKGLSEAQRAMILSMRGVHFAADAGITWNELFALSLASSIIADNIWMTDLTDLGEQVRAILQEQGK